MTTVKRRVFLKMAALAAMIYPADSSAAIRLISADKKKTIYNSVALRYLGEQNLSVQYLDADRIKDYLVKIRNPDSYHKDDIVLDFYHRNLLSEVVHRLRRLYKIIGYGNFAILGFDDAIQLAKEFPTIGEFSKAELGFLEMVYYRDAGEYGFFGEKQIADISQVIEEKSVYKVPDSGNYLYKGESFEKYVKIKKLLGDELLLTSGIRWIFKQFYLFLYKAYRHDGNLSLASRSLAPPGYSYHATGDFDIGQMGLGEDNFSERFIATPVFKMLAEKGYVECRYRRDNMLGVRYEPWHIKLI